MWHTQPFGDRPLLSQLSESIHLWLPFSNFSGHENHASVYEKCTISDGNSRDVLRPQVGTRLPQNYILRNGVLIIPDIVGPYLMLKQGREK